MNKLFLFVMVSCMTIGLYAKSGTYKYEINPRTNKFDITGYTNFTPSSNTVTTDTNQTIAANKTATSSFTFTADVQTQKINSNTLLNSGTSYFGGNSQVAGVFGLVATGNAAPPASMKYESNIWKFFAGTSGYQFYNSAGSGKPYIDITSNQILIAPSNTNAIVSTWTPTGLDLSGGINVSSPTWGNLSWYLENSSVTVINAADQFEHFAGTSVFTGSWFENTSFGAMKYVGKQAKVFKVDFGGCVSATAATMVKVRLYKNGSFTTGAEVSPTITSTVNDVTVSLSTILTLTTNDTIEAYVSSDDGDDIIIDNIGFSVLPVY